MDILTNKFSRHTINEELNINTLPLITLYDRKRIPFNYNIDIKLMNHDDRLLVFNKNDLTVYSVYGDSTTIVYDESMIRQLYSDYIKRINSLIYKKYHVINIYNQYTKEWRTFKKVIVSQSISEDGKHIVLVTINNIIISNDYGQSWSKINMIIPYIVKEIAINNSGNKLLIYYGNNIEYIYIKN